MGRDEEFSEYVAARWPRLVRAAVLLGCQHAEAEDVVQAALERCLVKWTMVSRAEDRDAYVHRILVNTFVSSRRRRWHREVTTSDLPDRVGPDEMSVVDDVDAVLAALNRLSGDQRAVVVLRYYAHLSERQMATVLGVAPGTVKSRLARALKRLSQEPQLAQLGETQ